MDTNINRFIKNCNKALYLTKNKLTYKFSVMEFHERIKAAIDHSGLKQDVIAQRVGITQPALSYLQNPENGAKASKHTVLIAKVCGVSPEWLADERGEMIPLIYSTSDPKLIAALKIMEGMPDYGVDKAIKDLADISELITQAKANGDAG